MGARPGAALPTYAAAVSLVVLVGAVGALLWLTTDPSPPIELPASVELGQSATPLPATAGMAGDGMGTWVFADGVFRLADPATSGTDLGGEGPWAVALADVEATDGFVGAAMVPASPGWGLVFRWADPDNFGWFLAAPAFAAWRVGVVVDGEVSVLGTVAPAPLGERQPVEVDVEGSTVRLWSGRTLVGTVEGVPPGLGTRWGIAGDRRAVGVAGWAGARVGAVLRSADVTEADQSTDGGT